MAATWVGLVATIAVGAVAGAAIAGSTAAASTAQQNNGKVDWETVGLCAGVGAAVGALASAAGYGIAKIVGLGEKTYSCEFGKGSFNSVDDSLNYHFGKHGKKLGVSNPKEYANMANNFAGKVLKSGAKPIRAVTGTTPNVYRYEMEGKFIHMVVEKAKVMIVTFGVI